MENVIRSLFFKDIRRLRVLLGLWAIVLVFKSFLYVGGAHLFSTNFEYLSMLPFLYRAVDLLEKMLVIVIVPMCLHEEPVVGSTAFWFSRPLSRKAVLITKGILFGVFFVGVPLVTEMAVLAFSGVPAQYVLLAAPEIILERLAFTLPFILLASITSRFSEYAKVGAIIVGVFLVWSIISWIIMMVSPELGRSLFWSGREREKVGQSFIDSMSVSTKIVSIIFYVGIIIHQHLTRYTARTIRWGVVAYLLVMVVGRVWTWDFLKPMIVTDTEITIPSAQIMADFDAHHMFIADGTRKDGLTKVIRSRFVLSGFPEQYYAVPDTVSTIQLWYDDGARLESWEVAFRSPFASGVDDALMPSLQSALGDSVIKNPWRDKFVFNNIFELGKDDFEKFKGKNGTYAVDMKIDFFDYAIDSVVPLRVGAVETQGRKQFKIFGLAKQKEGVSVLFMERDANMFFDRAGQKRSIFNVMANGNVTDIFVLRNRRTQEVLLPVTGGANEEMKAGMGDYINEGLRLQLLAKKLDFNFNEAGIALTDEWLRDAELVRLNSKLIATIPHKDVRISNFAIPAVSTDPDPALHNSAMSSYGAYRENQRGKSWQDAAFAIDDNKSDFRVEATRKATFAPTHPLKQGDKIVLKFKDMKDGEAFDFVKCGPQCSTAKTLQTWNKNDSVNNPIEVNVSEDGKYYFWMRQTTAGGEIGPVFISSSKEVGDGFSVIFGSGTNVLIKLHRSDETKTK